MLLLFVLLPISAPSRALARPHAMQNVEEGRLRDEFVDNEGIVLERIKRETHVEDDVRMAQ